MSRLLLHKLAKQTAKDIRSVARYHGPGEDVGIIARALLSVRDDILSKAPKICPRHMIELGDRAAIGQLDSKNCVYCYVEDKALPTVEAWPPYKAKKKG